MPTDAEQQNLTAPEPMPTDAEHLRSTDYLKRWSQLWAFEEPVAVVGAQICPSSSPSVICRGLECIDRSQSLPQRPLSVPFQAGLDLSLGRLEPVMGV